MEERIYTASLQELDNALDFLKVKMDEVGLTEKDKIRLIVAFEEMFVNVAHYAYPKDGPRGNVTIQIENRQDGILIRLIDSGKQFDPLKKEDPDITLSAEEREIGGLGIFMVKKTMDEVYYEYTDNKNIFTMVKKK